MDQEMIMQQLQAAVAFHNEGDLDQAEAIYRKVLSVDPNNFYALNFCGCICRVKKSFEEGIALLGRAASLQPANPDVIYNLGNVFKDAERWDEAIVCYEKTLGLRPEYPEALINLGTVLKEIERYEHSEIVIRLALSLQPGFAGAWLNLGNTLNAQAKFQEAIASYRKAIEVKPDFADAYFALGIVLQEQGDLKEAIASYRKAIESNQDFADVYFSLGIALKEERKLSESIASYRKAIDLKPDFADAYFALGIVLKEERDLKEAIASYRKAINLKPDFADAYFALGIVLKEERDLKEAIASYRKAIDLKPDFADAFLNLGNILRDEGELEEAIASYRKAIEVNPNFEEALFSLAHLLKDVGQIDESRRIVSSLLLMRCPEDQDLMKFNTGTLVFDWYYRRALSLSWEVERVALSSGHNPPSCFSLVKHVDSLCFPPLFLGDNNACEEGKLLYEKGYLVDDDLLPVDLCAQLIRQFKDETVSINAALIESLFISGVFRTVLQKILKHTGFPHLVWNCIFFAKGPEDDAVSDSWHYDNHYNDWTPKLMVYLNSQKDEAGATHFVDACLSRHISKKSDYMGFVFQRDSYEHLVKELVNDLNLDTLTLDPEHFVFSPERAGSGVWFCPSRSLHRGVSPRMGVRYVLSFSLTPLPIDCDWSVDECVKKSIYILNDKVEKAMLNDDLNPYWIPA